jgi:membrane protein DedA with SNARE-associated domain
MGIASMVIGIVSLVLGFFPLCSWFAVIPASLGLILGAAEVGQKLNPGQKRRQGMTGIIFNAAAIVIILLYALFFATAVSERLMDYQ